MYWLNGAQYMFHCILCELCCAGGGTTMLLVVLLYTSRPQSVYTVVMKCLPCVRFQHRRSSYKELQYICDGDSNGMLYFAGTSYGAHQWMNPVLSKVNFPSLLFCWTWCHNGVSQTN